MKTLLTVACALLLSGALPGRGAAQETAAGSPTRYVEIDGNQIGYRSIGAGTPLVLLTRFRGTLDTWDPLFLDRLAQAHQVVTVDYPGVGYSAGRLPSDIDQVAAFVNTFATKIGLTRFAVPRVVVGRDRRPDRIVAIPFHGYSCDPRRDCPSRSWPGRDSADLADSRAQTCQ